MTLWHASNSNKFAGYRLTLNAMRDVYYEYTGICQLKWFLPVRCCRARKPDSKPCECVYHKFLVYCEWSLTWTQVFVDCFVCFFVTYQQRNDLVECVFVCQFNNIEQCVFRHVQQLWSNSWWSGFTFTIRWRIDEAKLMVSYW